MAAEGFAFVLELVGGVAVVEPARPDHGVVQIRGFDDVGGAAIRGQHRVVVEVAASTDACGNLVVDTHRADEQQAFNTGLVHTSN